MAKIIVDEFVIQLNIEDKITKALPKLEKAAAQSSARIEAKFKNAFKTDFTRQLSIALDRLTSKGVASAKTIDKAFSQIGKRGMQGKNFFKEFRADANKAAQDAQRALNGVRARYGSGGRRGGNGGGSGGAGGGRPAVNQTERYARRLQSSAGFQRLQNAGGATTIRAREIQARFNAELARSGGDLNRLDSALSRARTALTELAAQTRRTASAERSEAHAHESASGGLGGLTLALTAAYTALEVFKKSLETGLARQAATRANSFVMGGFGGDAAAQQSKQFAFKMADQLGLSFTKTLQGLTGFTASAAPSMGVAQSQDFYKTASTFGRSMGLDDEKLGRAMTAFEQMASKGTISSEELKGQLSEAMPGSEQLFAQAYSGDAGVKGVQKLLGDMKKGLVKSADILPKVNKLMAERIKKEGGLEKIMDNTSVKMGRANNAIEGSMVSLESGFDKGFGDLSQSVANFFNSSLSLSNGAGKLVGAIFEDIAKLINGASTAAMHLDGYYLQLMGALKELDPHTQAFIKDIVKITAELALAATAFATLKGSLGLVLKLLGRFGVVAEAGAAGTGAAAAGGAVALPLMAAAAGGLAANSFWDNYIAPRSEGKDTTAGGNLVKDSVLGNVWDWLAKEMADSPMANGNWSGSTMAGNAAGVGAMGYKPNTQLMVQSTAKLEIPDKVISMKMTDVNGNYMGTGSVNVRDLISQQEEASNYHTTVLPYDFSTPPQLQY